METDRRKVLRVFSLIIPIQSTFLPFTLYTHAGYPDRNHKRNKILIVDCGRVRYDPA